MSELLRLAATDATIVRPTGQGTWPIKLEGVSLRARGRTLIDTIDLELRPGGVTAIMGPNGAGKSLLMRLIAGLIPPQEGSVAWGGQATPPRHKIGLVFQRPVLLRRSVRGNLDHALRLAGTGRAARPARIEDLLGFVGLSDLADERARVLSGGEQQRLSIARALVSHPALLILDEPTANLDPSATARIEALVHRIAAQGVRVLFVTHDRGQARRVARDVIFMDRGRIVEEARLAEFLTGAKSPAARAFLNGDLFP